MGRLNRREPEQTNAVAHTVVGSRAAAFVVLALAAPWLGGCEATPAPLEAVRAPEKIGRDDADEVPCAWFGDERDGVLWFGVSGFWSAYMRAGDDPLADLARSGPRWLGRHDLGKRVIRFESQPGGPFASGIWDVLAHPNGRVYFTTYFDVAGVFDQTGVFGETGVFDESGDWESLAAATTGLNELALGPSGRILATRYGVGPEARGAVVVLGEDGRIQAEFPLEDPPGMRTAAKSLAWDPVRGEIWVNTDLLPVDEGAPVRHDTRVLSAGGRELLRWEEPEVQFMVFGGDGTGYFAEASDGRLRLRIRPAEAATAPLATGRWIALDDAFPAGDFVQEVRVAPDGGAVVTRWSGRVHVVSRSGAVRDLAFPRIEGDLVYTGVKTGDRVCATVCRTQPEPAPELWVRCAELAD